jgi:hypothetical protein
MMKRNFYNARFPKCIVQLVFLCLCLTASAAWRSSLYSDHWTPPGTNTSFYTAAFLQDFSYAGYKRGEVSIPLVTNPVFNVTSYGADPSGTSNSTVAIQDAINAASAAGGGVVYMPAGTYKVAPVGTSSYSLRIATGNIVLRGAGVTQTYILNTNYVMRSKKIISIGPTASLGSWVAITSDLPGPTRPASVLAIKCSWIGHSRRLGLMSITRALGGRQRMDLQMLSTCVKLRPLMLVQDGLKWMFPPATQ